MKRVTTEREIRCSSASTKPLTACLTSLNRLVASPAVFWSRKKTYGFARYSRNIRTDNVWLRFQEKRRSRYSVKAVSALLTTSKTKAKSPAKTRNCWPNSRASG